MSHLVYSHMQYNQNTQYYDGRQYITLTVTDRKLRPAGHLTITCPDSLLDLNLPLVSPYTRHYKTKA